MNNFENNNLGIWKDMPSELYVIGDIHGDFFALKQSLELTNCILFDEYNAKLKINEKDQYYYLDDGCEYYNVDNNNVRWNPNKINCFIVFAGDIIDRCRPSPIINNNCINTVNDENCDYLLLKLLYDLDLQAQYYGSRVIVVLGNHEILNLQDDFRFVSLKGSNDKNRKLNIKNYLKKNILNVYGIVRINKYIIVHGGINDVFIKQFNSLSNNLEYESIELFNIELRNTIINNKESEDNIIYSYKSIFWDRTLGGIDNLNENQCEEIFNNNILNIKNFDSIKDKLKILVAHCSQFIKNKTINLVDCQKYSNRIYRIDVGMSRAFDFYNLDKIKNLLENNPNEILNIDYKKLFIINSQTEYRAVSCIKLTNDSENIIKGIVTLDYFFNMPIFTKDNGHDLIKSTSLISIPKIFHREKYITNKIRNLYIVSDIKKILNNNSELVTDPELKKKYVSYNKILHFLLLNLSK